MFLGMSRHAWCAKTSALDMSPWPKFDLAAEYFVFPSGVTMRLTMRMSSLSMSSKRLEKIIFRCITSALNASYAGVLFAPVQENPFTFECTSLYMRSARPYPMPT